MLQRNHRELPPATARPQGARPRPAGNGVVDFERVRQARLRAGLTQLEAARCLRIDPSQISRLERGRVAELTIDRLHGLALLYGVQLKDFIRPFALGYRGR